MENENLGEPTSDNESILTEDFAAKFQELCKGKLAPNGDSKTVPSGHALVCELTNNNPTRYGGKNKLNGGKPLSRDAESIRTEDFQTEFRKSLIEDREEGNGWLRNENRESTGWTTKEDSLLTEEFENHFRSLMVRGPPHQNTFQTGASRSFSSPLAQHMTFSSEDISTLGESASDVDGSYRLKHSIPRASELLKSTSSDSQPKTSSLGSLSNIAPMRRDIMSKFLEKYGSTVDSMDITPSRPVITRDSSALMSSAKRNWTGPKLGGGLTSVSKPTSNLKWLKQVGNRHSIAVARHQISPIPEMRTYSDDDISAEIRNKSEQIQREIQQERLRRNPPGAGHSAPSNSQPTNTAQRAASSNVTKVMTPRETLDEKMKEVDRLGRSLRLAQNEKQRLTMELGQLQETLRRYQAEVRVSSKLIQDRRSKAEGAHTELMLAEANRDTTQKCLDDMNLELVKKKQQLKEMENTLVRRVQEVKSLEDIGLTKEEIESVIAERNELYEIIKLSEESENQKYELEKQLTAAREDLTIEQRRFRERIIALEEELETSLDKISSLQLDKDNMFQDLTILEERNKGMFHELEHITGQNQQLSTECGALKQDLQRKQAQHKEEMEQANVDRQRLQQHVKEMERENGDLKESLHQSKGECETLQKDLSRLEKKWNEENEDKNDLHKSYKLKIENLLKDHEKALIECRENLQQQMKMQFSEKEGERGEAMERLKFSYEAELHSLHALNEELQEENQALKLRVKKQEEKMQDFLKDNEFDEKAKLQRALKRERDTWEREQEDKWRRELATLKRETKDIVEKVHNELRDEKTRAHSIEKDLEMAIKNLKDTEEGLKKIQVDKDMQLENTRKSCEKEIQRIQLECQKTIQQMEISLKQKEKELEEGAEDRRIIDGRYLEMQNNLRRLGMTVIGEVREECRRMMEMIKVDLPKFKHERENIPVDHVNEAVWDALANLRACSDEFQRFCVEIQSERDSFKHQMSEKETAFNQQIVQIRESINEEKSREVTDFKEQMLKDHMEEIDQIVAQQQTTTHDLLVQRERELRDLRRSMNQWKEETTEKIANQLQQEFRLEYERRLSKTKSVSRTPTQSEERSTTPQPMLLLSLENNPVQVINQLKKMVQKLREENISLRKVLTNKHVNEKSPIHLLQDKFVLPRQERVPSPSRRIEVRSGSQSSSNQAEMRPLMSRSRGTSESNKTLSPGPGRQTPQIPEKLHKSELNGSRPQSQNSSGGYPIGYTATPAMATIVTPVAYYQGSPHNSSSPALGHSVQRALENRS